jgi:hypothetical protein
MTFTIPPSSIRLSPGLYITNPAKFIEKHEAMMIVYKDQPRLLAPVKERLEQFKKIKGL